MTDIEELYAAHIATLTDRASGALEEAGYERVVLHAGDLVKSSRYDDLEHPFRVCPAFAHWVPWPWPGSAIVVEKGRAARLFALRRTDFWERLEAPDEALVRRGLGVELVDDLEPVRELASKRGTAFIGESDKAGLRLGFEEADVNPSRLIEGLERTRIRKTPYEVETLAEANRRAVRGHRAIEAAFRKGERSELQLNLAYLGATEQDASEAPYHNIVALGEAGAILHHHQYGRRPGARTLLVDAGASVRGYGSDITRTHLDEADPSPFRAVLAGMERLQLEVCARVEVGKGYEQLHDEAHELLGRLLVELGLVKCSAEAAVHEGITRVFWPHGLGHSLGVQVHDVGCRSRPPRAENEWLRNTSTIESGQVFTIEPGLYLIDALLEDLRQRSAGQSVVWERVDPIRPYGGIRIEDNLHVLDPGAAVAARNLTREAFASA